MAQLLEGKRREHNALHPDASPQLLLQRLLPFDDPGQPRGGVAGGQGEVHRRWPRWDEFPGDRVPFRLLPDEDHSRHRDRCVRKLTFRDSSRLSDGKKAKVQREYKNLRDCLRCVYREEGITGYYRGLGIGLVGILIYRSLYFGLYDFLKRNVAKAGEDVRLGLLPSLLIAQVISRGSNWSQLALSDILDSFRNNLLSCRYGVEENHHRFRETRGAEAVQEHQGLCREDLQAGRGEGVL